MRGPRTSPPGSARLFSDSHSPAPPAGVHVANIDGASRGNPGPAAYAVVIRDPEDRLVLELAKKFGRDTNNVAEYYALLAALDYATTHGILALRIRSDSELLVRQMQGRYKVKSPDLKPLYERASILSRQLKYFAIEHVRREQNTDADALANVALDSGPVNSSSLEVKRDAQPNAALGRPSATAAPSASPVPLRPRQIRARFEDGVLVPAEPLNLPEGTEVLLDLRLPQKE
jgi:ribonuclease HI